MEPTTSTIGTIVQAITRRYDAAAATGEWPDRPHWQHRPSPCRPMLRTVTDSTHCHQ